MESIRVAFAIAAKDLRQRVRDRSAVLIAVVVPLALALVFSLTLGDVGTGSARFDYAVVDEDRGDVSRAFVRDVLGELEREGVITMRTAGSLEEGRQLAAGGDVAATFVLPAGFSRAVVGGEPVDLRVIGDVDAPLGSQVARSIAEAFAGELNAIRLAVATASGGAAATPDPSELAALAERAAAAGSPVLIEDVSATRKELEPATYFAAGMAVFFLFFTVQFGVSSILDERREGTLARLLAAPVPRAAVLGGKLLTGFALGAVSMAVLAVATSLLLGAEWGNPLAVAVLVLAGVAAATGVQALVATFAKTPEQAGYLQAIVALVLGMLGGAFFQISLAGGIVAKLSFATPHAWFLRGLADLGGGGGVGDVLVPVAAILAFAAVTGAIALTRLGRLLQP